MILLTNIANAIVFLSLVTLGALSGNVHATSLWLRPATTVGIAVAIYFALIGPIFLYIAIYPSGGKWGDIWRVYAAPMITSVVASASAMAIGYLIPIEQIHSRRWGQAVRLTVITAWFVAAYIPLIRLVAPDAWRALLQRLIGLYKGRVGEAEPTPAPAVTPA